MVVLGHFGPVCWFLLFVDFFFFFLFIFNYFILFGFTCCLIHSSIWVSFFFSFFISSFFFFSKFYPFFYRKIPSYLLFVLLIILDRYKYNCIYVFFLFFYFLFFISLSLFDRISLLFLILAIFLEENSILFDFRFCWWCFKRHNSTYVFFLLLLFHFFF